MSKYAKSEKRTISYKRELDEITGVVQWTPLWDLSRKPCDCQHCARRDTPFCKPAASAPWFGADCANWLPRDVKFAEVQQIVARTINELNEIAQGIWVEQYATRLAAFAYSLQQELDEYLATADQNYNGSYEAEEARKRFYKYVLRK